ncbi:hypothetical protein H6P81_008689 [Aristolochia fimbriata]|uniref:Vacuolar ATPase assembly protein VMA22 n=1 Tax=Aristolochia fimbriata TaxID=158543 RepID=A0AAV7EJ11_ARIFI|nr:hypothetical protein H6P81_008689 [Aristolochia fimbriata]
MQFLDSMDEYLILFDSLSSSLRQGWLDLASARHSMGSSRITSVLIDLKVHPAASTVQVREVDSATKAPLFALSKWVTQKESHLDSEKVRMDEELHPDSLQLRRRGPAHSFDAGDKSSMTTPGFIADEQVQEQKERSKTLSMFGTLVSPKLRGAQLSFETALEILVEIANKRSLMLSAFTQLQEEVPDVR